MKPSTITGALGVILLSLGIYMFISSTRMGAVIPIIIGCALLYLAISRGRVATLVFGHCCILTGAYLITWGLLLLPHMKPTFVAIFAGPLFWGIFSLMGGICAIFHGFCRCVTRQSDQFEYGSNHNTTDKKS